MPLASAEHRPTNLLVCGKLLRSGHAAKIYYAHVKPELHCDEDDIPLDIEPDDGVEAEKVDNNFATLLLLHFGHLTSSASFVTSSSNLCSHSLH